ncbi:N-acetylglucosamine-6-phosphate deacetylase [Larsenimonas suaedae]|uniref:N-acetylglucosamine-6-phosphate deacetylase n=1 Tax=Larsenimonas suaedae TaxID=1851019 RepID=A0ABU1GWK0_9GAMM|nr:N-acetylglucosamine-6-phosphate deacetylase [Larsenimonas suaedae]MCM2971213.1 N-acetylglucosamine-6-phosphate deacetylase [Larsenimonas suaedae]MDR5895922.1 N-acetylglucosamine-6-phosphate deacetylase [Larsenimonas suaedae]
MTLTGHILTPTGWQWGTLEILEGAITAVTPADKATPPGTDAPYLVPGFIDLHVHGGGGSDAMEAGEAAHVMASTHARFGTTSLLATTMTAPMADIEAALDAIAEAMRHQAPDEARLLGVHLEGPFIHPDKLGAQPPYACPGTPAQFDTLLARAPIKVMTLAPDIEGHDALITHATARQVRVQIGHTCGTFEDGCTALSRGASGFTHLYNAMTPLGHRNAGIVGAALAHATFCEIIPDLVHVEAGAMHAAMRAIPRLYGITDATAAAGMPEGEYRLGAQRVFKQGDSVRLEDGTLAGSALTMNQALKNFMTLGDTLAQAVHRLSTWPAEYLGLSDRGVLAPGRRADVLALDRDGNLQGVWIGGQRVEADHG